jgi:ubiquinol-cytochrome c reductase cytochrome b subunit
LDALVFFGATGDLAYKKIFPALQSLVRHGQLTVPVIGVAKAGWNVEQLRIDHYLGKVIPGLIIALVSLHLRLVLTAGINEYPQPGKLVRKEIYVAEYAALVETEGVPFVPKAIGKDLLFSALPMVGILVCSTVFGPSGPSGPPDPTQINTAPRPDFYFLSLFALFALLPTSLETFLLLVAPLIALAFLFVLPFLSGTGEKSPRQRPVAMLSVLLIMLVIGLLASVGTSAPWSPQMEAWSGTPTLVAYVKGRTPLELQGALVLQHKQCRNCHSLGGSGGQRGPALDGVATRRTREQLIRQVLQGGGQHARLWQKPRVVSTAMDRHIPRASSARLAQLTTRN